MNENSKVTPPRGAKCQIHFSASDEIHTLSHLYESMLREMRDAAGDAGEFYTPRPVVRFMVRVSDPRLGDTVLDPACGTGGFLVEAYDHIARQVTTPEERRLLQHDTLYGQEAKPLPYMLAQMNLLLHGLEAPQIAYGNTLARRIGEIDHAERVDLILTNPPFGGEEGADIGTPRRIVRANQLILSKIDARNGAIGLVPRNWTVQSSATISRHSHSMTLANATRRLWAGW